MAVVYQIDYTFDDPNDLVNPVPLASAAWDATLVSSAAQAGATSTTFTIGTAPIWARVRLVDGVSSVRAVFTQYSQHSYSSFGPPPPPVLKPVNVTAPVVSGTTTVGSTLSCTTGTWTNSPTSFAYQWLRNGVAISGATASTYVVVAGDLGTSISCLVTATNAFGSGVTTSNALSIALPLPANTVAPVVSGATTIGSTLSCTTGTWTNSPTSYAYQWRRGGVNISGATSSTYVTVTADDGTSVGCVVTATNAGGSASQASNTLAISSVVASVWSAADATANGMTLSNGGLTVTAANGGVWQTIRNTTSKSSGKLYVEFYVTAENHAQIFGFADAGFSVVPLNSYLGGAAFSAGIGTDAGGVPVTGFDPAHYTNTPGLVVNDVWALAVDFTVGSIWVAKNNVWVNSSNPATGSLPIVTFNIAVVPALFAGMSFFGTATATLQATAASQKYLPPPGFQAWDGGPVTPVTSVWSAADATANGMTLSNGGLTVVSAAGGWATIRSTISQTVGKFYIEVKCSGAPSNNDIGFGLTDVSLAGYLSFAGNSGGGFLQGAVLVNAGFTAVGSVAVYTPVLNDVVAFAVDLTAGKAWMAVNNGWEASGNPAGGTNPLMTIGAPSLGLPFFPGLSLFTSASGTWTLQATAATQKYAPPAGFTAWDGGTAPSASDAYLARTVGGNEGGNGANIKTLIDGLVADGVWAKLDALYVLAQQNATDALLNLVGTSYTLTPVGSPTFTSYQGFGGFASNIYFDSLFNPGTSPSPHFTQNSASLGVWPYRAVVSAGPEICGDIGSTVIAVDWSPSTFYARANGPGAGTTAPLTNGLYAGDRSSSANQQYYLNGSSIYTETSTSIVPVAANFWVGAGAGFATSATISAAFIGASLGSAGQLALYNRLNTYMNAVAPTTFNPADMQNMVLSNGNLTATEITSPALVRSTTSHSTGKYHFEFTIVQGPGGITTNSMVFGLANSANFSTIGYLGSTVDSGGLWSLGYNQFYILSSISTFGNGYGIGDTVAVEVDFDAKLIWFQNTTKNVGQWNANPSANPATGVGGISIATMNPGPYSAAFNFYSPPSTKEDE